MYARPSDVLPNAVRHIVVRCCGACPSPVPLRVSAQHGRARRSQRPAWVTTDATGDTTARPPVLGGAVAAFLARRATTDAETRRNTAANGSRLRVSKYVWRGQKRDEKWLGPVPVRPPPPKECEVGGVDFNGRVKGEYVAGDDADNDCLGEGTDVRLDGHESQGSEGSQDSRESDGRADTAEASTECGESGSRSNGNNRRSGVRYLRFSRKAEVIGEGGSQDGLMPVDFSTFKEPSASFVAQQKPTVVLDPRAPLMQKISG